MPSRIATDQARNPLVVSFPSFSLQAHRFARGTILGAAIFLLGGCDGQSVSGCTCEAEHPSTWFDSLEIPSIVGRSDSLRASVVLPAGCTEFDRVNTYRRHDTLWVVPYYKLSANANTQDVDCAHGPASASVAFRLDSASSVGSNWISYPKGKIFGITADSAATISFTVR
jgi:hypothetical protein